MNRLFHGAYRHFDAFSADTIGMGAEGNSALGIWLSEEPHVAAGYGGGQHLMVVEAAPLCLAVARDWRATICGGPDLFPTDREIAIELFREARLRLMDEGFDGVWCEMPGTDLAGAVCVFGPEKLRIVEVLRRPEENDLDLLTGCLTEAEIDFSRALEDVLEALRVPSAPADDSAPLFA